MSHVARLLDRLGVIPDCPVEQGERPDFRLTIKGTRIGLEVTEFFLPSVDTAVPKYLPSLQNQAVYEAWQKFRFNGGPPLYASFMFSEDSTRCGPRTAKEKHALAEKLCEVVTLNGVPRTRESRPLDISLEVPQVDLCWIDPSLDGVDELWSVSRATMGANIPSAYVEKCLNSKAGKYESYAHVAKEVWLLIVNDWPMQAAACRISEDARSALYSFPFHRALWMDLDGDLVELRRKDLHRNGL